MVSLLATSERATSVGLDKIEESDFRSTAWILSGLVFNKHALSFNGKFSFLFERIVWRFDCQVSALKSSHSRHLLSLS